MGTGKELQVFLRNRRPAQCVPRKQERRQYVPWQKEISAEHSGFHENRKGAKCVPKKQEKIMRDRTRREAECVPWKQKICTVCSKKTGVEQSAF
jgi:hypothetical protein